MILQQKRMRWYGLVLRKEDNDWVNKCMEYEAEGSRPRGIPKRMWREVVQKDCQACNLNSEDTMDCGRWKKLIKIGWWSGWWGWVFLLVPAHLGSPGQRAIKWLLLWPPYVIGGPLYFCPVVSFYLLLRFFPRLISAATDWMSTILLHMAWP